MNIFFSHIEQDRLQLEHEFLLQQQMMLSKTATLSEMVTFKKELEKSERQREQLSDHLEVNQFDFLQYLMIALLETLNFFYRS